MAKETQDEKNLAEINAVFETRRALADHFSRVCDRGYGWSERVWRDWSAQSLWRKLLDITGKTDLKSGPAAITRWVRTKGPKAAELVEAARKMLAA